MLGILRSTAIYFTLGNIDSKKNSKFLINSTSSLMPCKAYKRSMAWTCPCSVLDYLKLMETLGVTINFESKQFNFQGTIAQVISDNPL